MLLITGLNLKAVLAGVAKGDHRSFGLLFNHYWAQVYGVAKAFTKSDQLSEEIAQDIFLKIWSAREELPRIQNFDDYLFIISRNHILNQLRKKVKEIPFTEFLLQYAADLEPAPDALLLGKQAVELVDRAVGQLPVQQRRVYKLSRENGLSHEAIAASLQISKKTVRSHIYQALHSIRAYLLKHSAVLLPCLLLFH